MEMEVRTETFQGKAKSLIHQHFISLKESFVFPSIMSFD